MDSKSRIILKALTWQGVGLVTMTLLGLAFTGSFVAGGGLALVSACVGLVMYVLHEALWNLIAWGRKDLSLGGQSDLPGR